MFTSTNPLMISKSPLKFLLNPLPNFLITYHLARSSNHAVDEIPVITYPLALKRKLIQRETPKIKSSKKSALQLAKPGKIFISCDNKSNSMYSTDYCNKFNPPSLTSLTWTSDRSPGRFFTIHPFRDNPSLNETSISSFDQLHLSKEILEALRFNDLNKPTVIQSKAIPKIINGNNVMFAAETGSGKTFAYLLPIFHQLLSSTKIDVSSPSSSVSQVLILTPTQELVKQVIAMAYSLQLPFKCLSLHAASAIGNAELHKPCEIIVATPSAVLHALRRRKISLNKLEFVVLDECDTLLDDSFCRCVTTILSQFNLKKGIRTPILDVHSAQLILSSATYPKYAHNALAEIISADNIEIVRSGYLHRISPHVKHSFLRLRAVDKLSKLIEMIEENAELPTMIFCNYQKTAMWLYRSFQEQAIPALLIDGKVTSSERSSRLNDFLTKEHNILITTDLLSRGIDTKRVKRIINYEVPPTVSDYIHRCGRVGRVGQSAQGQIITFVSKKWEVDVVVKIEEAARRREEIGSVSANIKRKHVQRWQHRSNDLEFV